ncbi:hypothetical protein PV04_02699 [Phialophora macrospora]|uniref:Uncharacterized protein n=1 Tax=Phialophora macrospora TaxID=1851006 RepID=A0A0D2GE59_9EURO|nr:hypothetical protein PV04_02699 [Phialophora macrospora]
MLPPFTRSFTQGSQDYLRIRPRGALMICCSADLYRSRRWLKPEARSQKPGGDLHLEWRMSRPGRKADSVYSSYSASECPTSGLWLTVRLAPSCEPPTPRTPGISDC